MATAPFLGIIYSEATDISGVRIKPLQEPYINHKLEKPSSFRTMSPLV